MFRSTVPLLAVLAVTASIAIADIGPKPLTSGTTPQATGTDLPGIEVEMAEEAVDLTVSRVMATEDRLDVLAVFKMKNHGETTTFETGFPIGKFGNFESFSIEIDGKPVSFDLASRAGDKGRIYWYVWQATYPGNAVSTHSVRYSVKIMNHSVSPEYGGYILHTGAPWKGKIGKAVVTLRCGKGLTLDQFFRFSPNQGGKRIGDEVVWSFEDFEPTRDHDITFYYHDRKFADDLAQARLDARTSWAGQAALSNYLATTASRYLRDRMTEEELTAYLDAVEALYTGMKLEGDRLVMPRKDPSGDRSYVSSPENLLGRIKVATEVVEKYPESKRAKEQLEVFLDIGVKFLAGKLYAGEVLLELPWRGATNTPEERARRDKFVGMRRAKIVAMVERGQRALSGN